MRDRAADVVAPPAAGAAAWGHRAGGCRCGSTPALAVGLVALGVFLPLFGISLVVVLLLDRFVLRRVPALSALLRVTRLTDRVQGSLRCR